MTKIFLALAGLGAFTACKGGVVDDPCSDTAGYEAADNDGDGYAADDGCQEVPDCADADADTYPGAAENEPGLCMTDADGDGYGDATATDGIVAGTDCDDTRSDIYPGAEEVCTETQDLNCDGSIGAVDNDGDGWIACEECNDSDQGIYPGAPDQPGDGIAQNCAADTEFWLGVTARYDGTVDLAVPATGAVNLLAENLGPMTDAQGDGYGFEGGTFVVALDQGTSDGAVVHVSWDGIVTLVRQNFDTPTGMWLDWGSQRIFIIEQTQKEVSFVDLADGNSLTAVVDTDASSGKTPRDVYYDFGDGNLYITAFDDAESTDGVIYRWDGSNLIAWVEGLDSPNSIGPLGVNDDGETEVVVGSRDGGFLYRVNLTTGRQDTLPMIFGQPLLTGISMAPAMEGFVVASSGYVYSFDVEAETESQLLGPADTGSTTLWGVAASVYCDGEAGIGDGYVSKACGGNDPDDGAFNTGL